MKREFQRRNNAVRFDRQSTNVCRQERAALPPVTLYEKRHFLDERQQAGTFVHAIDVTWHVRCFFQESTDLTFNSLEINRLGTSTDSQDLLGPRRNHRCSTLSLHLPIGTRANFCLFRLIAMLNERELSQLQGQLRISPICPHSPRPPHPIHRTVFSRRPNDLPRLETTCPILVQHPTHRSPVSGRVRNA